MESISTNHWSLKIGTSGIRDCRTDSRYTDLNSPACFQSSSIPTFFWLSLYGRIRLNWFPFLLFSDKHKMKLNRFVLKKSRGRNEKKRKETRDLKQESFIYLFCWYPCGIYTHTVYTQHENILCIFVCWSLLFRPSFVYFDNLAPASGPMKCHSTKQQDTRYILSPLSRPSLSLSLFFSQFELWYLWSWCELDIYIEDGRERLVSAAVNPFGVPGEKTCGHTSSWSFFSFLDSFLFSPFFFYFHEWCTMAQDGALVLANQRVDYHTQLVIALARASHKTPAREKEKHATVVTRDARDTFLFLGLFKRKKTIVVFFL